MQATDARPLSAEQMEIADGQGRLLASVREALSHARTHLRPRQGDNGARLDARARAIASLREEYATAGEEDRPAILAQMHQAAARVEARVEPLPNLKEPYFASMRLRAAGRRRDVLLGAHPFMDPARGVTILDWRRAPVAEVFFTCEPGDEYEIEAGGRMIEGVLERRHLLTFEDGDLSAISVEDGTLTRAGSTWRFEPGDVAPSLRAAEDGDAGAAKRGLDLDPHQIALLERDPKEPLIVLGSAGCGKTTVAIHRAASLCRRYPETFSPQRVLVLVPEPGLRRLAERMLAELGVTGVLVLTFDEWIRAEARRVFPWLPDRESPDPPFAVSRIKRHPAMRVAIDRLIDDLARSIGERLDRTLAGRGGIRDAILARTEPVLADRLRRAEEALACSATPARKRLLTEALREERRGLVRVRADHQRLVGDRALLHLAALSSGGELSMGLVEQVAEHTNRQLDEPSEVRFAHVAKERLATLDGRSLDDGTPEAAAGTVDVEDYALLFELLQRKTGKSGTRSGELTRYAHIVLDEAQELSPIELTIIGRAVGAGGSVTVAGDAAQRIDRAGYFASWEAVMEALGARSTPAWLETTYRSPRPIVELAHVILGAQAPEVMPRAAREGLPVVLTTAPSDGYAAAVLCRALRRLLDREPFAGVALIAKDAASARAVVDAIARAVPARLVLDGDFSFGPGIEVTEVANIKGLEFDYVIIPDATAEAYPDTPDSRRALHVAATRASRRLWILAPGSPSPILLGAIAAAQLPSALPRDGRDPVVSARSSSPRAEPANPR
jgi:DNA helicase-2/ATP-dependent DNA helicase PcrA